MLVKCDCCGELVEETELTTTADGKEVCKDCLEQHYELCDDCGEYYESTEMTTTHSGEIVCENCLDEDYFLCSDCGQYYPLEEKHEIDDGEGTMVCNRCFDKSYIVCEDCGAIVHINNSFETAYGTYICEECRYDHYFRCEGCDGLYHVNEAHWTDDECYCEDCYKHYDLPICSYHDCDRDKAFEILYTVEDEIFQRRNETFGFELEVSGDRELSKEYLKFFEHDEVLLMNDSSIVNDGFEIVSKPMTKDYFYTKFKPIFFKSLEFLRKNGFKGHNMGGLHVHINEAIFTLPQVAQLAEIMYGNKDDRKTWLAITQRKEYNMEEWSRMDVPNRNKFRDILSGYKYVDTARHTALNYDDERTFTYELRIFNSNIRNDRFMKNIECVFALYDYTKQYQNSNTIKCNTYKFLEYVKQHSLFYPNLYAFIEERQILENYSKDISEDILTLV